MVTVSPSWNCSVGGSYAKARAWIVTSRFCGASAARGTGTTIAATTDNRVSAAMTTRRRSWFQAISRDPILLIRRTELAVIRHDKGVDVTRRLALARQTHHILC